MTDDVRVKVKRPRTKAFPRTCTAVRVMAGVLFIAACSGAPDPRRDPIIRDSVGIRIVNNFDDPVTRWQRTPTPLLEIGNATDAVTSLYQVVGAHRLDDGRIVIANRGTHELRYYGDDGTLLTVVGRSGQGPGEFERIEWTARCGGDALYVYDRGTRRLTAFDDQGQMIHSGQFMLPNNTLPNRPSHCQRGGPFVTAGWDGASPSPGLQRNPTPVGLVSLAGDPLAMIGDFPGNDRWGDDEMFWMGPLPFGRNLRQTIVNDRVFVGTADTYEVASYRLDGTLEMLVRLGIPERPVTDMDVEAYIEGTLDGIGDAERRTRLRRMYLEMDLPTHMPPYAAFVVDDAGASLDPSVSDRSGKAAPMARVRSRWSMDHCGGASKSAPTDGYR